MSLISGEVVFRRTVELLGDVDFDLRRVKPPVPQVCYDKATGLGQTVVLWDAGSRPEFVIDEADLPY